MLDESTVCAVDVTELKTERWEQWHLQAPARVSESAEQLHVTPLLVLMMKRPGLVVYKAAVTTVKKVVPICT
ncbi:hypothetical protein D5086_005864 [Populus alba]|uniref:Uncharacterized protein n=1 Tax=Populus alba TaxID=43335 RepID=A0ACC4CUF4_POPAL